MKKYRIRGVGKISFDESRSVSELIERTVDSRMIRAPFGVGTLTFYDVENGRIVADKTLSCGDAGLGYELIPAQFSEGKFFFIDGDIANDYPPNGQSLPIPDPIAINLRFIGFSGRVIVCGDITLGNLFSFLKAADLIDGFCQNIIISRKVDSEGNCFVEQSELNVYSSHASALTLSDVCSPECICTIC